MPLVTSVVAYIEVNLTIKDDILKKMADAIAGAFCPVVRIERYWQYIR